MKSWIQTWPKLHQRDHWQQMKKWESAIAWSQNAMCFDCDDTNDHKNVNLFTFQFSFWTRFEAFHSLVSPRRLDNFNFFSLFFHFMRCFFVLSTCATHDERVICVHKILWLFPSYFFLFVITLLFVSFLVSFISILLLYFT